MSEKQKDRKIWLAAAVLGLALTLFLTGINTVRLKRENREIQARLDREINRGLQVRCSAFTLSQIVIKRQTRS